MLKMLKIITGRIRPMRHSPRPGICKEENIMDSLTILAICSIVVQFITERIKQVFSSVNRAEFTPLLAAGIGVVLAFAVKAGLFAAFGVAVSPVWIDYLITGIAFSGGATLFNELIKLIRELRPSNSA